MSTEKEEFLKVETLEELQDFMKKYGFPVHNGDEQMRQHLIKVLEKVCPLALESQDNHSDPKRRKVNK